MSADDDRSRIARLDAALAALEAAVARVAAADRNHADLADSLAVMDDDRQRLATDLDAALARAKRLEAAGETVEHRLRGLDARLAGLLDENP